MDQAQKSYFGPRLFVIAALAVAAWALVYKSGVASSDEAGVVMQLPDTVGDWRGVDLLFCSNRKCGAEYIAEQLTDRTVCPKCGAPLSAMNWAERSMLPTDTGLVRKYYTRPGNRDAIQVSIVLSGNDRSSIHRPQVCMTAAGYEIVNDQEIQIPLPGRDKPLDVMVLDMARHYTGPDGQPAVYTSYYVYWFVGKGRETASHFQRMLWMGYDRVFHGISHRWAYIAMSGDRNPGSDYVQTIADFASQLYPALLKPE